MCTCVLSDGNCQGSFDVNKIQRDMAKLGGKVDMLLSNSPYTKALVNKMDKKKMLDSNRCNSNSGVVH